MSGISPREAREVRELVTYLTLLNKGRGRGRVQEAGGLLRRSGSKRLGEPSLQAVRQLDAIEDIDRLENLADRLVDPRVASRDDLLHEA